MDFAIEASEVTKNFGKTRVLDRLSFSVKPKDIFGLIGPNGAGKTTALRIVSTLLLSSSGTVKVFGLDVVKNDAEVRKIISYLPEEAGAYKYLQAGNT